MAKAATPAAPAAPTYDPSIHYQVKVSRPVKALGLKLRPLDEITFRGAELNDLVKEHGADVVAIAVPVT